MKALIKKIEDRYTSLKADIMISESDPDRRDTRIVELRGLEEMEKKQLKNDYEEMQGFLQEVQIWVKLLKISKSTALQLLIYRETKRIHWHLDQLSRES